jgi:DNA repair photolyase
MQILAERGIRTGVTMMPILPFIEDDEANVRRIVELAADHGASYIIPWFGMSLRDRQRAYYYARLDELFPGLREQYERTYGDQYGCTSPNARHLETVFVDLCHRYGITTYIEPYRQVEAEQMTLF